MVRWLLIILLSHHNGSQFLGVRTIVDRVDCTLGRRLFFKQRKEPSYLFGTIYANGRLSFCQLNTRHIYETDYSSC